MSNGNTCEKIVITEPNVITTTVVDGILDIETKGEQFIFTFYEDQRSMLTDATERRVAARFSIQAGNLGTMIKQAADAAAGKIVSGLVNRAKAALQLHH